MSQGLKRIHHVEFVVGNAKQASYFYRQGFGFDQVAYRGPDLHGDGVRDVALEVDDLEAVYGHAVEAGARSYQAPGELADDTGKVLTAGIHAYGEVLHTFVQKDGYEGVLPGFVPAEIKGRPTGLAYIDHVVGNLPDRQMDRWVEWYDKVLGLSKFVSYDDKDISTEYTALRSTVVASADRVIKFPLNEPAKGKKKSQIQEYIDSNLTAGVQHTTSGTGSGW